EVEPRLTDALHHHGRALAGGREQLTSIVGERSAGELSQKRRDARTLRRGHGARDTRRELVLPLGERFVAADAWGPAERRSARPATAGPAAMRSPGPNHMLWGANRRWSCGPSW